MKISKLCDTCDACHLLYIQAVVFILKSVFKQKVTNCYYIKEVKRLIVYEHKSNLIFKR